MSADAAAPDAAQQTPITVIGKGDIRGIPCRIVRDGKEITDANRNVLPGEQINLAIEYDSGPSTDITDISWSVDPQIFDDFSVLTGSVHEITDADLHGPLMIFRWADCGEGRAVSVKFKLRGDWRKITETFNVKKPQIMCFPGFETPPMGSLKILPAVGNAPAAVILGPTSLNDENYTPGMKFYAAVATPAGFPDGEWCFCQVLKGTVLYLIRNATDTDTVNATEMSSQDYLLDKQFPYDGIYPANGTYQAMGLPPFCAESKIRAHRSGHVSQLPTRAYSSNSRAAALDAWTARQTSCGQERLTKIVYRHVHRCIDVGTKIKGWCGQAWPPSGTSFQEMVIHLTQVEAASAADYRFAGKGHECPSPPVTRTS